MSLNNVKLVGNNSNEVSVIPRLPRELSTDAIFHVYQRGNNKEHIFKKDEIKGFFIHQIKEYNKKFDFEILAFVIMDNHYHMIIKLNNDPLDRIMFNINNVVVHYLNRTLSRTGHAFDSRYKCKRVDSDAYLIWLLRYIHRNPIRANIAENVENYKWSSHYCYKNKINSFVNTQFILGIISSNMEQSLKKYLQLMDSIGDDNDDENDYSTIKGSLIEPWQQDGKNRIFEIKKQSIERETLEKMADRIFRDETLKNLILTGSKRRHLTDLKLNFIKEALNQKYTLKEVSCFLNNSESAISLLLSRNKECKC